ncbi:MAG: dynamin family protein [Microcystis sp. LE19-131.1A]|jgi:tRNA U34 5-carboxymethylaminomethyl modifying GTPase MnmE/TrmE|uniref:dynamin family protein n=1 Tax=Microcystis TaxID=1125 RepID=UPI0004AD6197|nr:MULTISPECIES: dynamin family protein [Microcystis]MCZ8241998.1 dynamin family protein [Microcystis sp. LE19-131.1A]MDB9397045.1 dynamin family protein [Microcystis aeruginosa CS-573]
MSWMYGLSLLASSGINAWSASENRKSSESISRLNRDSSEEIARLSRKHSAELQYNQLKFSVLQQRENQEFQRELAELNHERAKEIEAFRAKVSHAINQKNLDFQKWRFEQEKKIQYDILQLQQDFQRELSRLQHQNAVELMRERVRSDKSPIHNQAFDLLENSFAHPLMPLQVLISPPQLNYDPKTGKPYLSGFEDTLAEEIHQFLSQGHALNQEWPVQFLNGNWISNSQGGNAALLSLHSQLKSIHVLVLDTKIPLDKLNFSVGYWFSGDTTFTRRPILSGQSFPDLLYESAKKRALEWEKKREKIKASGKDEAYIKALGKVDEENLQIYFQELAGIAELKQTGVTDLLIRKEYKITEEDYKTFYQYLAVWHCLAIGLYADILFLGNSWENIPLLPSLIPYLLEKYRDNPLLTSEFWQEAISSIVKVYGEFYNSLRSDFAHWATEIRMELALSLANLPSEYQCLALEQGNQAFSDWLRANDAPSDKVFDLDNDADCQLLKRIIYQEDKPFLESLKLLLEKIRGAEGIDEIKTNVIGSFLVGWEFLICPDSTYNLSMIEAEKLPAIVETNPEKSDIISQASISCQTTTRKNPMSNQTSSVNFEATEVRLWFADQLDQIRQTLVTSEKQAAEASGKLALSALIDNLRREVDKLKNAKFRFLIIGDFNRGKSSILNVLFGQELLPMGVTPTTSIPTFIQYGEQAKVIVYKKDGTQESMGLKEYQQKYTFNSKQVKDKIKNIFKTVENWLNSLEKAEIYYPIELLSRGVEFIDTAGLNSSEAEDRKTLSYIPECHAILFVLSAHQQLTAKEQAYLNTHIKDKVGSVFFLINQWELVPESDKEEIHEAFVERLSDCLTAKEEEIEQMWEDTIFDVYARTALERLKEKNSLDGTGFMQFSARLDHFLIHERLIAELLPSLQTATSVTNRVTEVVEERLLVLNETVKSLEEKIRKVNPHIKSMKTIAKGLRKGATNTKNACIAQVGGEYQSYFSQILSKIENDFTMPPVAGLGENQKENYTKQLEKKFQEYQQEKLDGWKKISAGIVANNYLELTELFSEENKEYDRERQEIKEILEGKDLNIQNQSQLSTYQTGSTPESSLKAIDGNATKKMILAGSAATVGTITAGVGVATAANVYLGTHILLAAGLAVTPIGAALLAVSVVGGGLATWWGRRSEIDKFQKGMQKQLAQEFQKLLEPEQISGIKEAIGNLFVGFESYADQLKDDVESLESSLNNLLESKRSKEVDAQAEAKRLEALKADISAQWETINVKYKEIATAKK